MDLLRKTSWDALLAFAEFAETRNFTRAAARLHLSQPALHTKIGNLSAALGTPLYVRRGREIDITESGRKVQRFARELEHSAAEFAGDLTQGQAPAVVLAAGEGSYLYLLGAGLRAYRAKHSHPLRLETATAASAVEAVSSARAHLGVAALDRLPRQLVIEPLTRVGQVLALPTRHPLASRRQIQLKDLRELPLILPPDGRPHRVMVSQALQSAGIDTTPVIEASGWELMLQFVQLGFGSTVVNACCRMPPGVVARPMPELPEIQYHLFHSKRLLSRAASELRNQLLASADDWRKKGK